MLPTQTTKKLIASCVYCTNPPDGEEHWLNRSLGRFKGAEMLKGRVCDECNKALGTAIDVDLVRTAPTGVLRQVTGIKGRSSHEARNVFEYKASELEPPIQIFRRESGGEREVLEDIVRQSADGTMVSMSPRSLVVVTDSGETELRFPRHWSEVQLRLAASKRGLLGGSVVRAHVAPPETIEEFRQSAVPAIRKVFGSSAIDVFTTRLDGEVSPIQETRVQFNLSPEYHRCLAKVAFHYFLWACPEVGGDEPEFEELKTFIRHGTGEASAFLQAYPPHVARETPSAEDRYAHLIGASSFSEDLLGQIHFFFRVAGPSYPTYVVRLGRRPAALPVGWCRAHTAIYVEGIEGHDGIFREMMPVKAE